MLLVHSIGLQPQQRSGRLQMKERLEKLGEGFIREAFDRVEDLPHRSWVATHGFCLECGARIDPKRLLPQRVTLFCLGCEEAAERTALLGAVFGS